MAHGGHWAATAWSSFLPPWAQPSPVAFERSSSVTPIHSHPDPCSSGIAPSPTDRHCPLQIWEGAILNHSHSHSQSLTLLHPPLNSSIICTRITLISSGAALSPGQFHAGISVCVFNCLHSGLAEVTLSSPQRFPAFRGGAAAAGFVLPSSHKT